MIVKMRVLSDTSYEEKKSASYYLTLCCIIGLLTFTFYVNVRFQEKLKNEDFINKNTRFIDKTSYSYYLFYQECFGKKLPQDSSALKAEKRGR